MTATTTPASSAKRESASCEEEERRTVGREGELGERSRSDVSEPLERDVGEAPERQMRAGLAPSGRAAERAVEPRMPGGVRRPARATREEELAERPLKSDRLVHEASGVGVGVASGVGAGVGVDDFGATVYVSLVFLASVLCASSDGATKRQDMASGAKTHLHTAWTHSRGPRVRWCAERNSAEQHCEIVTTVQRMETTQSATVGAAASGGANTKR